MAEKRAKDRVILKLLGVAGDMYSEEEADEFKRLNEQQETELEIRKLKNEIKAEKTKETKELNKQVDEYNKTPEGLKLRYKTAIEYIKKIDVLVPDGRDKKVLNRTWELLGDLSEAGLKEEYDDLNNLVNQKMPAEDNDEIPTDICQKADYLISG